MAEFVMKDLVRKAGRERDFVIESAATSNEEIGNDIHPGTRKKLDDMGVAHEARSARRIVRADYDAYDFLIGMDDENLYYMRKTFGEDREHKMSKLLEWCGVHRDVADPWYTGNFDATWDDVLAGCRAISAKLS